MRRFLDSAASTPGTVIDNIWRESNSSEGGSSWSAYPQVRFYQPNGEIILFTSRSGTNPPSFQINQRVTVLYDPGDPQHAYIQSFGQLWMLPILLGAMGVAFTIPEICLVLMRRSGARKEAWLQQNGRRVQACVTEVALNNSYEMNGAHPFRIVCQWQDPATGRMHLFYSANIWYDPSKFIPSQNLEVLVDPGNPLRYSVLTPFLPKMA
jgi:Protein of unknown function (DUF3592)